MRFIVGDSEYSGTTALADAAVHAARDGVGVVVEAGWNDTIKAVASTLHRIQGYGIDTALVGTEEIMIIQNTRLLSKETSCPTT